MANIRQRPKSHGGHFTYPMQMLLGLLFLGAGSLLLLKKFGLDYISFLAEEIFVYICAVGSVLGGLYLIWHKLWRPRIYI